MGTCSFLVYLVKRWVRLCSGRRQPCRSSTCAHFRQQREALLKTSVAPVFDQSDFLILAVCGGLDSALIARLRFCCRDMHGKVGHAAHVAFLVNERRSRLPGLRKLESAGTPSIMSLRDLRIAETPSMEAVLCIFGFASTEPHFDDETVDTMAQFAELLREYSELQLQIEGHGQPGAPEPLASNLAQERADNVAIEFTRKHGVPSARMKLGHCSNRNPRYRDAEKNRRVELSVVSSMSTKSQTRPSRSSILGRLASRMSMDMNEYEYELH